LARAARAVPRRTLPGARRACASCSALCGPCPHTAPSAAATRHNPSRSFVRLPRALTRGGRAFAVLTRAAGAHRRAARGTGRCWRACSLRCRTSRSGSVSLRRAKWPPSSRRPQPRRARRWTRARGTSGGCRPTRASCAALPRRARRMPARRTRRTQRRRRLGGGCSALRCGTPGARCRVTRPRPWGLRRRGAPAGGGMGRGTSRSWRGRSPTSRGPRACCVSGGRWRKRRRRRTRRCTRGRTRPRGSGARRRRGRSRWRRTRRTLWRARRRRCARRRRRSWRRSARRAARAAATPRSPTRSRSSRRPRSRAPPTPEAGPSSFFFLTTASPAGRPRRVAHGPPRRAG